MSSTIELPAKAAVHFYNKSVSFNPLIAVAFLYSSLAAISISCLRPIPLLNRGLPQVQEIPTTIVGTNKVAIITGSNTGIGFESAKSLVERGYEVVFACRSKDKALAAIQRIRDELPNASGKAVFHAPLDLSDFQSVHDFSDSIKSKYDKVDLLINNAGRNSSGRSPEGLDICFQTNFLSHFLLTRNLMDLLLKAPNPRVVNLSSVMHHYCQTDKHDEAYWKENALYSSASEDNSYSASKLAALLFTIELNKRYRSKGLRSIAVNPGGVNSDIWRNYPRWVVAIFQRVYLNNQQGAYTSVAASVIDDFPEDVIYLQPYHQLSSSAVPWPPTEMLGPFVGYQAIQPRLPKDGQNGRITSEILWAVSEELTTAANKSDKKDD